MIPNLPMPEAIPDDITREDVLAGIDAYVNGADHDFADSIAYDLLHEGKRYPPKAILGLAAFVSCAAWASRL